MPPPILWIVLALVALAILVFYYNSMSKPSPRIPAPVDGHPLVSDASAKPVAVTPMSDMDESHSPKPSHVARQTRNTRAKPKRKR